MRRPAWTMRRRPPTRRERLTTWLSLLSAEVVRRPARLRRSDPEEQRTRLARLRLRHDRG